VDEFRESEFGLVVAVFDLTDDECPFWKGRESEFGLVVAVFDLTDDECPFWKGKGKALIVVFQTLF